MIGFADILAQDAAVGWLRAALASGRLPHGLVFAGPAGVGKATTARALAGAFLCEKPPSADAACGRCASCQAIAHDTHPDYHVVYRQLVRLLPDKEEVKARDVAVDVIREFLNAPAGRKPVLGRGKVFVVEEAELMNIAAQNALLKTLEEPYGRTLIVLLTSMPDLLLPTIRSRCQVLRFGPLPQDIVARELKRRGIADADAADAAEVAEGSLGLSLRWLADGVVSTARTLARELETLTPQSASKLPDLLKAFSEDYVTREQSRDPKASKEQVSREALALMFSTAANHLRRRLIRSAGDGAALERLCDGIDAALSAEQLADQNVATVLCLEHFAQSMAGALSRCSPGD